MITIGCLVDMWHTYTELGVAFTEALNLAQCPWPALPPVFWPGFWSTVMSSATCSQIYRGCWFQDVETNNMTCEFQPAHVNKVHVPKQQNQILKQQKVGKWNKHRFRKAKGGNLLSNRIGLMVPVWCMFICGYLYIFVLCWSVGRHGRDWLFCGRRVRLALVLWIWGCCYQPSKKTKELRLKNPRILIGSCPDINISLLNS